jgi:hypothetical protein
MKTQSGPQTGKRRLPLPSQRVLRRGSSGCQAGLLIPFTIACGK